MDVKQPPEEVQVQLDTLSLDTDRPLLAVDVDEVIVGLAGHLAEYATEQGYSLRLTSYKLDGALWRYDGTEASAEEFQTLFRGFFKTQTLHQRVYPGVVQALSALAPDIQIIILTNVPFYAHADRIENLRGHGIDFPVIANAGPKGPALRWLHERAGRTAFIDDSPSQLASSAKHAPDVSRIHFIGDEALRGHLTEIEAAQHRAENWADLHSIAETILLR